MAAPTLITLLTKDIETTPTFNRFQSLEDIEEDDMVLTRTDLINSNTIRKEKETLRDNLIFSNLKYKDTNDGNQNAHHQPLIEQGSLATESPSVNSNKEVDDATVATYFSTRGRPRNSQYYHALPN
ncbi:hypothetical protein Salat_0846300 [Sesamum alatum]|uniref:Uncharacterized protein n=1 Tax=Sesamum alatum TaxID=300844 RepID=A0AAE1YIE3_9LAMI|nr:hypothetical protein Salat_0846300 [Sesamum alatum]